MRLTAASLKKSRQIRGKYELAIYPVLTNYLETNGYQVKNHVSLNIAWGSIVSQVDAVGIKNNEITVFEIKTKHDKLSSYKKQYNKIKHLVDYYYIVIEKEISLDGIENHVGVIYIQDSKVTIDKIAKKQPYEIKPETLEMLKKEDLLKLTKNKSKRIKYEMSKQIIKEHQNLKELKKEVQGIILNT